MNNISTETALLHNGWEPDAYSHATTVPIYLTNAYGFESTEDGRQKFMLEKSGDIYTRLSNPTTTVFEKRLAALEKGSAAVAFSSGHAAIYAAVMTLCACGDHIVSSSCIYGGAINMFNFTLKRSGITVSYAHPTDLAAFEKAITPNTKLIFTESMGNPTCDLTDIDGLAEIAHRHGIALVVDNTFTPFMFRPIEHGADIVIHSTTKYIGGQGCVMGGAVIDSGKFCWDKNPRYTDLWEPNQSYHGVRFYDTFGERAFAEMLRACTLRDLGACPSPFNSFELLKGLETLPLRMRHVSESAKKVCAYLSAHPAVQQVRSPNVPESPYYKLGRKLFPNGFGGMLCFDIKGGREVGGKFIDALNIISNVANLGDSISLVSHPASTTHSQLSDEELLKCGIGAGTIRLSLGLESADDIIADLDQAFQKALA